MASKGPCAWLLPVRLRAAQSGTLCSLLIAGACLVASAPVNAADLAGISYPGTPSSTNLGVGMDPAATGPVRGPCVTLAGGPSLPTDQNATALGTATIYYVRSQTAMQRAETISASSSFSASIPFVASVSFNASSSDDSVSNFERDTLRFVYNRSYVSQNFGQVPTMTPVSGAPTDKASWAVQCGTKVVTDFVYGAVITAEIDISNVSDAERASLQQAVNGSGGGVISDIVDVSGSASYSRILNTHLSRSDGSVQVKTMALGSRALVQAINGLTFSGVNSYGGITSKINAAITGVSNIAGPVAYRLSNYPPGLADQTYTNRSQQKATALVGLSSDATTVSMLRSQTRNYSIPGSQTGHAPWNTLPSIDQNKRDSLTTSLARLKTTYNDCYAVPLSDSTWDSGSGPSSCNDSSIMNPLNLANDPTYGLPQPPPISAFWIATAPFGVFPPGAQIVGNGNSYQFPSVSLKVAGDGGEANASLRVNNAYINNITLRFISTTDAMMQQNAVAYNGAPPGVSSNSPTADLPLFQAHLCGSPYRLNGPGSAFNLAYYLGRCNSPSIRDRIQGFLLDSNFHYPLSANVLLDVYTIFGQHCTWQVMNWNFGSPLIYYNMITGPFDTGSCDIR